MSPTFKIFNYLRFSVISNKIHKAPFTSNHPIYISALKYQAFSLILPPYHRPPPPLPPSPLFFLQLGDEEKSNFYSK